MTKKERAIYRGKRSEKYILLEMVASHLGYSHSYISLFEKGLRHLPQEKEIAYKRFIDEY